MLSLVVEIVGVIGGMLILCAYLLLTMRKLGSDSRTYQAMNLAGAIGFVINGFWHRALPSAILNVIWAVVALVALWRIGRRQKSST